MNAKLVKWHGLFAGFFAACSSLGPLQAATFSDANWVSMGGFPGANGDVYAAAVDGAGNLYIGGYFTAAGGVMATNVAKWDGSSWSALGSGIDGEVDALAVSGSDVFAGGWFTAAGALAATASSPSGAPSASRTPPS
jgi:hypothetical protein